MGKTKRIGIRCLVLAGGFLLASVGLSQYNWWCENPIPPCDPNSSQTLCYLPPLPDPRCKPEDRDECNNCTRSPCYVGSGSYETTALDLSIRTVGFPLELSRRYDSTHAIDGPLGKGWTTSVVARVYHAVYLLAAPSTYQKEVFIQMPEGGRYRFADNGNGTFTPPLGRHDTLIQNQDGTWALTLQRTRSVYRFDASGALTSMTDDYGNQLTVAYDGNGRVQQVADASGSGRYLNVLWGPDGRISTIQDSSGRQIQYSYNAQGALSSMTNPLGQLTTYAYFTGRFGPLLAQIKDHWNRVITDITYDTKDRVASYTDQGETYTYTYAYGGNPAVTAKTDSVGNRWVYPFTAGGLVSDTTPPSGGGGPTHTDYYPDGLPQQFTDGVGVKTFYTYDQRGNPLSVTRDYQGPTAVRFDYTYDPTFPERVISIVPKNPATAQSDPNWQGWKYDYHPTGSPAPGALHHVYRVRDDGVTSDTLATYEYDSRGQLTRQTSATGGVTDYTYNTVGDLASVTTASNNDAGIRPITVYGHNPMGRITSVTSPLGHATTYTYDALDRLLTITPPKPSSSSPLSFQTTYTYDLYDSPSGLLFTHVTDANSAVTKGGYDQSGRVVRVVDALSNATAYAYVRGLLSSTKDANNNITSYGYDAARRMTSMTLPDGTTEQYTYTGDNLPYQRTDRRNQTTTFSYDRHKRLSQRTYPSSNSIVYTYQGQKLTQVVNSDATPAETHLYSYDTSFRLASETQGSRGTVNYQYNPEDGVATYSVQGAPTATYTYYPDGALSRIVWSPVIGEFRFTYTLAGRYQRITFPNGQYRNYSFDDQMRLLELTNVHPTVGNLATYAYSYDLNYATGTWDRLGQRTSMTATVPSQNLNIHVTTYEYDALYQLTKVAYPNAPPFGGEVHSWTYDALGNRVASAVNGSAQSYSYQKIGANPLNWQRLLSDGLSSYSFDPNGNTATRSGSAGVLTFGWNADDRLSSISGAATASYTYDHEGRRTARMVGVATTYLYSGLDLIREDGTAAVEYLFGPQIDEPLAVSRGGVVSYYQVDALGSVNLLADSAGTVQNSYVYDAWGTTRSSSVSVTNPFGYTARDVGEAATLFYRARYYSPEIGRFLSEDPVRFAGAGIFQYTANNPVFWIDPSGLIRGDRRYGYPAEFWRWYHRQWKQPGDPDAGRGEARRAYDEWIDQGKPTPDGGRERDRGRKRPDDGNHEVSCPDTYDPCLPMSPCDMDRHPWRYRPPVIFFPIPFFPIPVFFPVPVAPPELVPVF